MKFLLLSFLMIFLFGCTTAPLTEQHTARTLGKDKRELALSAGSPGYVSLGYTLGWTDRLDVSGVGEIQAIGMLVALQAKYLLTPGNPENPLSFFVGLGTGTSTRFAYAGPLKSFRTGAHHEISFGLRYNVFKWDIDGFDDQEDAGEYIDDLFGEIQNGINGTYSYASLDISNTYWFTNGSGVTLSLTGLYGINKIDEEGFKAGLKFHSNY